MLSQLYLKNYALFAQTEITFPIGLNILTGETGAGKSLLVGALGLIMGKRADNGVIFYEADKCVVEATFKQLSPFITTLLKDFEEFDIEEDVLMIRREIRANGKSRAFINDTPVSLQILRQVSSLLLDLHGQHENQVLLADQKQRELLDIFAGCTAQVVAFGTLVRKNQQLSRQIHQLQQKEKEAKEQWEYLQFQLNELDDAQLKEGEEEQLEQEILLLQHAEEVQEALGGAVDQLYEQDLSIYHQLGTVLDTLKRAAQLNPQIAEQNERLNEVLELVRDSSDQLRSMLEVMESDPERLSIIEDRLGLYHRLKLKYSVSTGDELIAKFHELSAQMSAFESIEEDIRAHQVSFTQQLEELSVLGLEIERSRLNAKPLIEHKVNELLSEVGFNKARFEVVVKRMLSPDSPLEVDGEGIHLMPSGINKVYFQIQSNPGVPPGLLSQIASGGEISRVMLALKAALADKSEFPVLIFDEIDTGISGEIANKVGGVMQKLANKFQIISITHLPQIAAKGHHHFKIYKEVEQDRTTSSVKALSQEDRIQELAVMISGDDPTESAIKNAAELMSAQ